MIFLAQRQLQSIPERQVLAEQLYQAFHQVEAEHPGAMIQAVKEYCAEHHPGITVGQIGGTITVSDNEGILVRIRTAN